jgi:hypothetical protein
MIIIQGNTYKLPIRLKINGEEITDKDVKKIEFMFGDIQKIYPKDVTFNDSYFIVSLSQTDTFSLPTKRIPKYQARVLFNDDSVKGTNPIEFVVIQSESKEVLS